ncbi:uncharacterized protein LOC134472481 [Cavia porcellus]|uniref:uncharacterized protein LOC134472481 n=1 Tax=Cavia porcellus TaxID=10141 RepID=UPI002FE29AC8
MGILTMGATARLTPLQMAFWGRKSLGSAWSMWPGWPKILPKWATEFLPCRSWPGGLCITRMGTLGTECALLTEAIWLAGCWPPGMTAYKEGRLCSKATSWGNPRSASTQSRFSTVIFGFGPLQPGSSSQYGGRMAVVVLRSGGGATAPRGAGGGVELREPAVHAQGDAGDSEKPRDPQDRAPPGPPSSPSSAASPSPGGAGPRG